MRTGKHTTNLFKNTFYNALKIKAKKKFLKNLDADKRTWDVKLKIFRKLYKLIISKYNSFIYLNALYYIKL